MLGGVAVADGDGVVFESIEVNYDALRSADFVLLAIAFADVAGIVPGDATIFGFESVEDFLGFFD